MNNKLNAIDNALNNTSCHKMIESLLFERKAHCTNWKVKAEELRQEELRLQKEKEGKKGLLEKIRRLVG